MKIVIIVSFVLLAGFVNHSFAIESCNCVALRLDDVQDYWLDNVQINIIHAIQQKNASLTIGVIGNYFGKDSKMVNLIKEKSQTSRILEIANHGWNHEDFTKFTEKQQSELLNKTDQKIHNLLGVHAKGFIPPYDLLNRDTIEAVKENNLSYISANKTTEPPPYSFQGPEPYRFPELAEDGGINKQHNTWESSTYRETYAQTLSSMINWGYAVIVLHPQDFSVRHALIYTNQINATQLERIEKLIDKVRYDGFKLVTIGEISQNANYHEYYPQWLNNVVKWYSEKKISDDEFINSIEFLKSKDLLTFSSIR